MTVTTPKGSPENSGKGPVDSPYTYREVHGLRSRLSDLKFAAAYWVWQRMIHRYAQDARSNLSILEVGCGAGNFVKCLKGWYPNARLSAIDLDEAVVAPCALRHPDVCFARTSSEQLPFASNSFDVISALQVIEHFPCPEDFLAEAHRVLRHEGVLLLATPNTEGLAARRLGEAWPGIRPDHISLRTPNQWRSAITEAGFESLSEGTTLFAGFKWLGRPPLSLPFQLLQSIFGWFPWPWGESFMMVARRTSP